MKIPILFNRAITFLLLVFSISVRADVVVLNSGEVVEGSILRDDSKSLFVQLQYGTATYQKSEVKSYQTNLQAVAVAKRESLSRLPGSSTVIAVLAKEEWAHSVKQIPATVIDKGVLRRVPYISFKSNAGGYQINVYGDLDNPSGVEIGTFKLISDPAKSNCLAFLSKVLVNPSDRDVLESFPLNQKTLTNRDGITFETTLPNEPDAYGGWWVTVYDEAALDKARVSDTELASITELRDPPKKQQRPASVVSIQPARPASTSYNDLYSWTASELADLQPSAPPRNSFPTAGDNAGEGRVYVRGYTRSDGTYVRPHTRSSPRR